MRIKNLQYFYQNPSPLIGAVFQFTPDTNANYNALLTELKKNFKNGLLIDAQYTYSKSIDEVSAEGPGYGTNQTYPTDLVANAPSGQNRAVRIIHLLGGIPLESIQPKKAIFCAEILSFSRIQTVSFCTV